MSSLGCEWQSWKGHRLGKGGQAHFQAVALAGSAMRLAQELPMARRLTVSLAIFVAVHTLGIGAVLAFAL